MSVFSKKFDAYVEIYYPGATVLTRFEVLADNRTDAYDAVFDTVACMKEDGIRSEISLVEYKMGQFYTKLNHD